MGNLSYFKFFVKWVVLLSVGSISRVYGNNMLIDCGSSTNTTVDDRVFSGDSYASSYLFTSHNLVASTTRHLPSKLFKTARVFKNDSKYIFPIELHKRYLIRLYICPLTYKTYNLSNAKFSVKAEYYTFLSDFTPSATPTIKEFYINMTTSKSLTISFLPSSNSFAFINGIELVQVPDSLYEYDKIGNLALETRFRVNVGGPSVTPKNDILGRLWTTDDMYLEHINHLVEVQNIKVVEFRNGLASRYNAPKAVYGTGRRFTIPYDYNLNSKVTWKFVVDSGFPYLVRLHFCDILGQDFYNLRFSVFVNSWVVSRNMDLYDLSKGFQAAPLYIDFVTPTIDGEKLDVSIGLLKANRRVQREAILNGIEIIKMNNFDLSLVGIRSLPSLQKHSRNHVGFIVWVVFVGFLFILAIILCAIHRSRSRSRSNNSVIETEAITSMTTQISIPQIPFSEIQHATGNFNEHHFLGGGGFGKVYLGVFGDGSRVAVKRHEHKAKQGFHEFQVEVQMLKQFSHRHLVSLLWCCAENNEFILGYEYMENGTLKDALHDPSRISLTWKQRLEICIGVARALEYLHTGPTRSVIHGDVKPSNILLDGNLMAKLADFGLSKIIPELDQSHVSVSACRGTLGYIAPENVRLKESTKSDVYSFGAVLFEVLCAKDIIHLDEFLPDWARKRKKNGELDQVIDLNLQGHMNPSSFEPYWELADICLAEDRTARPSMAVVLSKLEYILALEEGRNPVGRIDNTAEASTSGLQPCTQDFNQSDVGGLEERTEGAEPNQSMQQLT